MTITAAQLALLDARPVRFTPTRLPVNGANRGVRVPNDNLLVARRRVADDG